MLGWQRGQAGAWIAESHKLAKTDAYGKLPGFACSDDGSPERVQLTEEYVSDAETIIPEQLAKAGARIAHVLNRTIGE